MGLNRSEGGTDKAARLPKGWTGPVSKSGTQAAKAAWVFLCARRTQLARRLRRVFLTPAVNGGLTLRDPARHFFLLHLLPLLRLEQHFAGLAAVVIADDAVLGHEIDEPSRTAVTDA